MTEREAMLAAIRAHPDEDTPRLIYADWLDENGEGDRAAFIRAQIEAVRAEPFGLQARTAIKRAAELLEKHRVEWHRDIREAIQREQESHVGVQVSNTQASPIRDVIQVKARFERGFVGHVSLQPAGFVRAAAGAFAAEPIQSLELLRPPAIAAEQTLKAAFEVPQLSLIRRLEFSPGTEFLDAEYTALAECPHLTGLTDLSVRGCPVYPPWVTATLSGGAFPGLQGLNCADIPNLGPGLVAAFAAANHREFRRLDISGVVFNSEQLRQVLTSRCLRNVEELRLGHVARPGSVGPLSHINPGWVVPWDRLVIVDLDGQRLGNEAVGEIVKQSASATLRWLGLARNGLDGTGVRYLTESKHLNLNYLDMRGNNLTPSNLAALKARFPQAIIQM